MKKFLFTIAAIAFGMSQASAQTISFGPLNDEGFIEVPQGGQATVAAQYTKESTTIVRGYKFTLTFQDEYVNTVRDKNNLPVFNLDSDNDAFAVQRTENNGFSALPAASTAKLSGTEGSFGTLIFEATADAEIGSTHLVKVSNAGFTIEVDGALKTQLVDDFTFTVKIVENRITLDENAEEAPAAAENVNVKVLRTIKADNWSTICLPFAMTEDQVVKAFGDDVQVAEFTACKWDKETENISLTFTSKAQKSIEANHPLLIKVTTAITHDNGFNVDNVTIEPGDAEISVVDAEDNEALFIGTYEPIAKLGKSSRPALFIANNQFYFSKGTASLKPYRAYFEIDDLKNFIANAKIGFLVDDEATAIDGIGMQHIVEGVYDLSGRKIQLEGNDLNKLQKGVYIIDGKKVTIK